MSRARTWTTVLTGGLAITAALAACGSPPPPPAPPAPGAAAARPDPRPTAEPVLTEVMGKLAEQSSVRTDISGNLGLVGELDAQGVVRYEGPRVDLAVDGATQANQDTHPQPVDLSMVDGVGYLKTPLAHPEPDKPWVKVVPGTQDFVGKLLSPALSQMHAAADPRTAFAGIEPATRVQSSTPEELRGTPTTRYELRVLTAEAAELAEDPQQRERFRKAADSGRAEFGYQLWLDEAGLPAKFAATQQVAQAGQVSLTSTYHDWGAPADIQPPPPEEIGVFRDAPMPQAQPPG
ncbi:hypothetical protein IQ251_15450 [Saccharopolyspora sp. HNM0983]|uniref:Lipoprotein n=1 Tax=Saccharopolyspora montiporae TaxID=2781240 RepID=A0A929FYI7_9PSEU|nr:hypothetical protein [Saccharopolyspora sp. HNM0983]MBE9375846.1 hypothetical protein [Saccharopolyspora sp. HNM0983]